MRSGEVTPSDVGEPDVTEERILDAALATATDVGLRRLSVGDVARTAGISRPTIYKRFPSRNELVFSVIGREATRMIDKVRAAGDAADDPESALRAAIEMGLVEVSDHPLLRRLLETEPEALIPLLVSPDAPLRAFVSSQVDQLLDDFVAGVPQETRAVLADVVSRLFVSHAVDPSSAPPSATADVLTRLAMTGIGNR